MITAVNIGHRYITDITFQSSEKCRSIMIDTGAMCSCITKGALLKLLPDYRDYIDELFSDNVNSGSVVVANGTKVQSIPIILRYMKIDNLYLNRFYCNIIDSKYDLAVIGMDLITAFGDGSYSYDGPLTLNSFSEHEYEQRCADIYKGKSLHEINIIDDGTASGLSALLGAARASNT